MWLFLRLDNLTGFENFTITCRIGLWKYVVMMWNQMNYVSPTLHEFYQHSSYCIKTSYLISFLVNQSNKSISLAEWSSALGYFGSHFEAPYAFAK
jgi:hypothetical protein